MSHIFKKAVRENVSLLVGLAGASGSGKTYTAMRLAAGISGDKPFAVIDTENGRASHYADAFKFDVLELHEPFTPESYAEAIKAADDAGYPVIVVDSASHEYAGAGGILDMQEAEFERMGGRESAKMASWVKPKGSHKRMMQRLLQTKAHLILCFRAEAKIEMVKKDGKLVVQPKQSLVGLDGWVPVTEKTVPFELTVSLLLTPDHPGIPQPIKLQEQHKALFPLDKPINEESGKRLAEWASGTTAKTVTQPVNHTVELTKLLREANIPVENFLLAGKKNDLSEVNDLDKAKIWIEKNKQPAPHIATNEGISDDVSADNQLNPDEAFSKCDELLKEQKFDEVRALLPLLRSPDRRIVESALP